MPVYKYLRQKNNMRITKDYAYARTKPITRKAVVLSALDAFIGGLLMVLFIGMTLVIGWLMFGH